MQEEHFTTEAFPEDMDIVYVLRYKRPDEGDTIPFYVGESRRGTRRIGDYLSAQFAASTDFKVGMAVQALREAGCEVFVSHQRSNDRRTDEAKLIDRYTKLGHKLLNSVPGYNYRSAQKSTEKTRIQQFVTELLQGAECGDSPSAA